ncbi:MAG: hypothetical protein OEM82_14435, partial [Acidobacteriota bacterium]|nr:hypothetical protein [Acidobacteriota bacterium]
MNPTPSRLSRRTTNVTGAPEMRKFLCKKRAKTPALHIRQFRNLMLIVLFVLSFLTPVTAQVD